jgi:hypothetical protein
MEAVVCPYCHSVRFAFAGMNPMDMCGFRGSWDGLSGNDSLHPPEVSVKKRFMYAHLRITPWVNDRVSYVQDRGFIFDPE